MHHSNGNTRRGSTLITVTILLGTMTVLALIFLRVGQRVGQEQDANLESTRTTLLAEAGISEALEAIRSGQSGNIASADDPAYLGGGVLWVVATDLGSDRIQLDSMAMKGDGRAALRVVVEDNAADDGGGGGPPAGSDGFFGMLFADSAIDMKKDLRIDSFDSSLGTYASQAVHAYKGITYAGSSGGAAGNGSIEFGKDAYVFGDVHTGPGYTLDLGSGGYVSGSTTPANAKISLAPVVTPVIAPSGAYSVANNQTKTLNAGNYHYTNMTLGQTSKLVIKGPANVIVDGFTGAKNGSVQVDCTKGPVLFYDTGSWSVAKEFSLVPVTGSPVEAAFLFSSLTTLSFKKETVLKVGIYAPKATISIDKDAEIWGGLVGKAVAFDKAARFHFDTNLAKIDLPWEVPADYMKTDPVLGLISWSKIPFPEASFTADRHDPFTLLQVQKADLRKPSEAWEEAGGQ